MAIVDRPGVPVRGHFTFTAYEHDVRVRPTVVITKRPKVRAK